MRVEVGKDVQLSVQGFGGVQIKSVFACPTEGFAAGNALEVGGVDFAFVEDGFIFGAEVFANDGDDADFGKERGRDGKVKAGTAQAAFAFAKRRFD